MAITRISAAAAIAGCNAIVDLIDAGASAGTIKIYTGSQPADPDAGIGGATLLGTLTFSDPAFGNAVDGAPGGVATADVIAADLVADATGTATWFRVADSNGVAIIDGDAGTTTQSMILNTDAVVAGATLSISAYTFTVPQT
jgi:hypothetical protein